MLVCCQWWNKIHLEWGGGTEFCPSSSGSKIFQAGPAERIYVTDFKHMLFCCHHSVYLLQLCNSAKLAHNYCASCLLVDMIYQHVIMPFLFFLCSVFLKHKGNLMNPSCWKCLWIILEDKTTLICFELGWLFWYFRRKGCESYESLSLGRTSKQNPLEHSS